MFRQKSLNGPTGTVGIFGDANPVDSKYQRDGKIQKKEENQAIIFAPIVACKVVNNMKDTRYINTEEVLNILDVCSSPYLDDDETKLSDYINDVKAMITANASEQKTAHWIHSSVYTDNRGCEFAKCKCSNCGHEEYAISYNVTHGNYCPDCGFYIKGEKL